jgi:hypothetical protein
MISGKKRSYSVSAPFKKPRTVEPKVSGAVKAYVARAVGSTELKYSSALGLTYAGDTTGQIALMNGVTQGDDFTNREGRKFTVKAIQVQGKVASGPSTVLPTRTKVLVILDKQANGALPTMTDIFQSSSSNSFMNMNNVGRFKVLASKSFVTGGFDTTATQTYSGSPQVHDCSFYIKCDIDTINMGTTNGIASISTNSILFVVIGDNAAGDGAVWTGGFQIRFQDK